MKNILVGLDFHEKSDLLIDKAEEFAKAFGAKVWIVHIAAPDPDYIGNEVGPQYIRDHRAKELREEHKQLLNYADQLDKQGIESDGLLIQGATTDMLLEESEKLNIDLIITGHHDRSFMYKIIFGSVTSQLISRSDVPVLVVPL